MSEVEFDFWLCCCIVGESGTSHGGEDVHTLWPCRPSFLEEAWLLCLSQFEFDERRPCHLSDFRHPDYCIVGDFVLPDEMLL